MPAIIEYSNWWHSPLLVSVFAYTMAFVLAAPTDTYTVGDVCLSDECKRTASAILAKLKPEIEPCNDFYQFACGKYIDEMQIPEDKISLDIFDDVSYLINIQLKDVIQKEAPATNPKHFRLPNLLYKACMNEELIESMGTEPIKEISEPLGGWPVVVGNSWNSDNSWSWQKTIKQLRRFDPNYIITFSVITDFKDSTKNRIMLSQPDLGPISEYLKRDFNDIKVSAYYDYMVDIAVLFGAEKQAAQEELRESLQFEMDLAKIGLPAEEALSVSNLHNLRTIKELQVSYPYIEWLDYINARLPEDIQVDENEEIILRGPSFFDKLGDLLQRTNKRAIANYIMWCIHATSVYFLPKEFHKRQRKYKFGMKNPQPRWKECIRCVKFKLPIPVAALYVQKYFNRNSKAAAQEMVDNLRSTFSEMLDKVQWMEDLTKKKAQKKLQTMVSYIGYPNELLDNDKLEDYYRELEFDSYKYFELYLNLNVFYANKAYRSLRLPVNRTNWFEHSDATVASAFYGFNENSLQLPAGILQGQFFNSQRPKYLNYGAIGSIIGHEITHGFDNFGCQFDHQGNLIDWWQPKSKKAFLEKANCIVEQYGNMTEKQTGLTLNGKKTLGENIADNGGLKESYLAYNKWVAKNGKEPSLPGLNYTANQMFWISAAQTWCAKIRTEYLKKLITIDKHSLKEYRVLGSFRNMKDFAKDFQCAKGMPMNPVLKCEVW